MMDGCEGGGRGAEKCEAKGEACRGRGKGEATPLNLKPAWCHSIIKPPERRREERQQGKRASQRHLASNRGRRERAREQAPIDILSELTHRREALAYIGLCALTRRTRVCLSCGCVCTCTSACGRGRRACVGPFRTARMHAHTHKTHSCVLRSRIDDPNARRHARTPWAVLYPWLSLAVVPWSTLDKAKAGGAMEYCRIPWVTKRS
jgi:hypothetical protein